MFNCILINKWYILKCKYIEYRKESFPYVSLKSLNKVYYKPKTTLSMTTVQKSTRQYFLYLFFNPNQTIAFYNKNKINLFANEEEGGLEVLYSYIRKTNLVDNIIFIFKIHNLKFIHIYNKILITFFSNIEFFNRHKISVVFVKPNYYFLKYQKKKFKSIKKSRKKSLYNLKRREVRYKC